MALVATFVWDRKERKDQRKDRQERHKETAELGASQGQVPGFSPNAITVLQERQYRRPDGFEPR